MVPEIRAGKFEPLRELGRQPRLDLQHPIPVLLHFSPIGRQDPFDLLAAERTQRPLAFFSTLTNTIRLQTRPTNALVLAGEQDVVARVPVAHDARRQGFEVPILLLEFIGIS